VSEPLEFEVLTIFPQAIEAFMSAGIMARSIERELVVVRCTDLRAFTHDRHRSVDDAPFGGGPGMVIKAEPVAEALDAVIAERGPMHTILLTPSGARFDQRVAERLAGERRIALLCGRYEGIDDRIREHFVDECLSIGDFVLNGGEVAAAVVIEAVSRLREGVLGNPDSLASESFDAGSDRGTS
jgi:tRNA (guanine-N1)-methyltransferase